MLFFRMLLYSDSGALWFIKIRSNTYSIVHTRLLSKWDYDHHVRERARARRSNNKNIMYVCLQLCLAHTHTYSTYTWLMQNNRNDVSMCGTQHTIGKIILSIIFCLGFSFVFYFLFCVWLTQTSKAIYYELPCAFVSSSSSRTQYIVI